MRHRTTCQENDAVVVRRYTYSMPTILALPPCFPPPPLEPEPLPFSHAISAEFS